MFFWYDHNGIVAPWPESDLIDGDIEHWKKWAAWMSTHALVCHSHVGVCLVVTGFVGKSSPGGMFFTSTYDARGEEMDCVQTLTIDRAYEAHARMKKNLEKAMRSLHGEYYPSRP